MNSFLILDKDGNAITIGQLDIEAAKFWNKELSKTAYANPTQPFENKNNLEGIELSRAEFKHNLHLASSWYDTIGWYIAQQGIHLKLNSWANVVDTMMSHNLGTQFIDTSDRETYHIMPVKVNFHKEVEGQGLIFDEQLLIGLMGTLEYFRPYINLINYWAEKGYTPKQIINK